MADESQLLAIAGVEKLQKERDDLVSGRALLGGAGLAASRKAHEASGLKSDMKKASAYVNKIRSINSEGLQQCIRDTESINLGRYIEEIVGAIVETQYKATDVPLIVKLCICLHRRYAEFTNPLIVGLRSSLLAPPNDDDKTQGIKRRIQIRVAIELFQAGLYQEDVFFDKLLRHLCGRPPPNSLPQAQGTGKIDLQGLGTFVKYGSEILLGFTPKAVQQLYATAARDVATYPLKLLSSPAGHDAMRGIVAETYDKISSELAKAHKDLRSKDKRFEKDRLIHGSITETKQQEMDACKRLYEKLLASATGLCEVTDFQLPPMEEDPEDDEGARGGLTVWEGTGVVIGDYGPFGDAETKAFYEELPDLLSMVPLTFLGLTPEQAQTMREAWKVKASFDEAEEGEVDDAEGDEAAGVGAGEEEGGGGKGADGAAARGGSEAAEAAAADATPDTPHARLQLLLSEKLPECLSRQRADEFCVSFCYLNSKTARKSLLDALHFVPRSRTELVATYSRIVASLSRVLGPELKEATVDHVRRQFSGQLRVKDRQLYIEDRLRTARYLAELIKFNLAPPIVALKALKDLLADFSNPQSVEVFAALLEACGRFLYLLPHVHGRVEALLETMLRLRRAKNMDQRHQALLEGAYYMVKPPERSGRDAEVPLSPVQKYARWLLLDKLDEVKGTAAGIDAVIRSLRRLPWGEEDLLPTVLAAIKKTVHVKHPVIPALADALSGLQRHMPNLVIIAVDALLEELQRGLERPNRRHAQHLLGTARMIGELYNYEVLSASVVYETLYHIINAGHELPPDQQPPLVLPPVATPGAAVPSAAAAAWAPPKPLCDPRVATDQDPPADCFRAQLVCEILKACGSYYVKAAALERLNRFLAYFQRYLLVKPSIALHVEFALLDTFDWLETTAREAARRGGREGRDGREAPGGAEGLLIRRFDNFDVVQAVIVGLEAEAEKEEEKEGEKEEEEEEEEGGEEGGEEEGGEEEDDEDEDDEDDDEDDDDDDDDDDDSSDESSDDEGLAEEEASRLMEKLRASAEEDEEFDAAFRSMMQESIEAAHTKGQASKADLDRMALPALIPRAKNIRKADDSDDEDEGGGAGAGPKPLVFKLLSRDHKGRIEARELNIPSDTPIAQLLARGEAAKREERERVKHKVLQLEKARMEQQASLGFGTDRGDRLEPVNAMGNSLGNINAPHQGQQQQQQGQQQQGQGQGQGRGGGRGGADGGSGRGGGGGRSSTPGSSNSNSSNSSSYSRGGGGGRAADSDSLNLDGFLQQTNQQEMRQAQQARESARGRGGREGRGDGRGAGGAGGRGGGGPGPALQMREMDKW